MNKRNSYIAAAALAVAGTAGMASWIALDADELRPRPEPFVEQAAAPSGVAETEGVLESPVASIGDAATDAPMIAPSPAATARQAATARTRAPQAEPTARATRTPVESPARTPSAPPARASEGVTSRVPDAAPAVREPEPIEPVEPVEPRFVEVTIPSGSVLGVRLSTNVSSDTAEIEDRVEAVVTRDLIAGGRVAVPAGTKVLGSVNEVERGGKFRERARLGIRFHTLVLADGTREPVRVDPILREGDSPARASVAKIGGGAVGGAIIGGIMGGKKGAILGGAAGAGAGTAVVAAGERSVVALTAGTTLSVRLDSPVIVTIEKSR